MENYAEFAQLCLSRLKKNEAEEEEHSRPLSASSLIRFYGRPILPPLLSGKQREEMRRHRDEAQEAKANRKLKDDSKMAYVQTILHSVQLRKTPTLQDLLQEMETKFECPHLSNNGRFSVSCSDVSIGTRESLSPGPAGKLKNGIAQPPKISITYSAFFPSSKPPQQSFQEEYLTERLDCQQGSQPCSFNAASHQSLSSGYVTCENQENATADSVHTTEETSNNGGFFLHSTSNTIAKMPDIISHPPIDGEEKPPSKAEAEPADIEIDVADLKQPEESRPLSLQALLKKSQEYRRRQRMLRNQAKNTKMHQERMQEKPKERVEEPSLSDKENDELHHKGAVTIEGKKTKEGRGTLIWSEEPSPQKPWKTHRFECKGVAEDGKAMERLSIEEETFLKNKLNSSQEVIATPKQVSVLIQQQQQQSLMKTSLIQGTFNEPPGLPSFHGGVEKYRSVPVPSFCLSPVPCKNKTVDAAGTPEPKSDSSSDFNEVRVKDINLDHQQSPTAVPSGNVIAGDDATRVFAKGSLHIDELESNLCSLKVLISDLESTVKENLDDRREPDCSVQSNENLESSKDYEQIENAGPDNSSCCLEDTQDAAAADDDDGNEVDDLWQRQSFIQFMNMDKDVGPNPRSSLRDVSLQNGSEIIKLSQHSQSLNQSYDVDTPSDLWLQEGSGSDLGSQRSYSQTKGLTPESGGEDQSGVSKVKRRLLMHVTEGTVETTEFSWESTLAGVCLSEGCGFQKQETLKSKQERLKQIHAAQVRALQEEHRKQQEELLQVLATRYRLLQDVSPCSRLGDTLTFSSLPQLHQPLSPLSQRCRPLVAAAVKGFLTRRLLRTERVAQLVRTIRDTQQFLQAFQQQSASRGDRCSRQDVLLQERVALQLRAARYEVYDIFFSLPAGEQMQLIRWDRELARERQLRRQNGHAGCTRGKSSLSAATQKSLERKRERMIQKKAAECHRGSAARTGPKSGFSVEKKQETKNRGHFKANPQRVPKSVCSSRPR
uniref:Centriolar coiled-coil protein 110 n=1 Tax=Poecilia formosa TaxID=48698 RepID=A0A096LZW3_POEFO